MPISAVLNKAGLTKNSNAARDMLKNGSVKVDQEVVEQGFKMKAGAEHVIQAGKKKFARVKAV
jgi:tyrosyl-tRNA synthetase